MPANGTCHCWGCGDPAPGGTTGFRRLGWQRREVYVSAPSCDPGKPPRSYRMVETVCPGCFTAAGGWYEPPAVARMEVA